MTEKSNSFDPQEEFRAPGTLTRNSGIDNHFCREIEKCFCADKVTRTLCLWTIHVPNEINSATVIPTIGANALQIVIALKNVTLVSNKKSILVQMFDFTVTKVHNFCKNELITVMIKFFDGKDASLVFFQTGTIMKWSAQMLNYIFVTMTEQLVFCFCNPHIKHWFG